jgi:hypothetical protein
VDAPFGAPLPPFSATPNKRGGVNGGAKSGAAFPARGNNPPCQKIIWRTSHHDKRPSIFSFIAASFIAFRFISDKLKTPSRGPRDIADYHRRLRAAGLDPEGNDCAENIDAFRNDLARRICMFVNNWNGCQERICKRQHGRMAPSGTCSNVEKKSPEERERRWREVQPLIYKALKEEIARRGHVDD